MFEASLSGLGGGVCLQHLLVRSWNRTGNLSLMPKKTFFFALVLFMKQLLIRHPIPPDLHMHISLSMSACSGMLFCLLI